MTTTASGWTDDRMMQAYDLIDLVCVEHKIPDKEFKKLLSLVEEADALLEEILTERKEA